MRGFWVALLLLWALPCWAAEDARKVDFTTVLTDEDDKPISECAEQGKDARDCKVYRPVTIGAIVLRALVAAEPGLAPDDSVKRGGLGLALYKATAAELAPEDIVLIKKQVSRNFNPLLAIRVFRLIDPTVK